MLINYFLQIYSKYYYLIYIHLLLQTNIPLKTDHKLFLDDNASEISYELPSNEIPIHLLISDYNLRIGN